ncbi:hypothetical protein COT70_01875 [candidate division WWE3 bacterium CG09_land_8_20_14_0_10_47_33]|uniref:ATPase n=1 Tax=candidate division WWE3 bacterium CG_4_9_14_0_2_um_filter_48_10 TaxID=1975078 RepID=A0A2M8EJC0_UNCKA|nr:MAG: hypothetical protein COT70_01875 [candidate division WWE3 bacterium CG09_land_8_20_14_0_10_47_33]PIZ41534.1 MAG: hypothetical protein COY35_00235 [candidate division WWE3 bacterium CG_4_10_14_0_2_um_filter_47_8]PJC22841.1 MAG: hypothetical protein CO059_01530 [candidate division WWE3 bacterium CG_4_9_14_0_2_um_filter_48_10]
MEETHACCHQRQPWYREPLFVIGAVIFITFITHLTLLLFGSTLLSPLFRTFWQYLKLTWWAILLGLAIGGLIEVLIPPEFMVNLLARGRRSIIIAVFLGFLASACSHGILAIAVSLYKKGASTASTLTFLLASPWANLSITFLLLSLFGSKALFIIGGALVVALISGFIFQILEDKGLIEGAKLRPRRGKIVWHFPGLKVLIFGVFKSVWDLAKMVVWWILLGFFLASVLGAYIPERIFHQFFGPTILGMLATLVLASIIEVCSEGSSPLAFELYKQTGAFGNAFVFLQAGVVTDFTEVGIVLTNIGKRAALALVLVTVPLVLLLGFLFNTLIL